MSNKFCGLFRRQHLTSELNFNRAYSPTEGRLEVFGVQRQNCKMKMKITPPPRSVARGVGGAGGPGTAKVFFNEKIDCSLVSEIPRGPHWLSTALPPPPYTHSCKVRPWWWQAAIGSCDISEDGAGWANIAESS